MADSKRGPITPDDARSGKASSIPDAVFDVVNELLSERFNESSIRIDQADIVKRICERMKLTSQQVFDNGWLDFESAYRGAGWSVEYDKPGFNETYEPTFIFKQEKRR